MSIDIAVLVVTSLTLMVTTLAAVPAIGPVVTVVKVYRMFRGKTHLRGRIGSYVPETNKTKVSGRFYCQGFSRRRAARGTFKMLNDAFRI